MDTTFIQDLMKSINVENYEINELGEVTVVGDVVITDIKIPIKFCVVTGNFIIKPAKRGKFVSLEGCPPIVGGDFVCSSNMGLGLSNNNLKGGPVQVGGDYNISGCCISDLSDSPRYIGGSFMCQDNALYPRHLKGAPRVINGLVDFSKNSMTYTQCLMEVRKLGFGWAESIKIK